MKGKISSKNFTQLIGLIVVLIFVAGITCYLGNKNKSSQVPVSSPTPINLSNWKTYTDSKKGFSFKYPQNFSFVILSNGVMSFLENTNNDYESCKKDLHLEGTAEFANTTCWLKNIFNFNGFSILSKAKYEEILKDNSRVGINQLNYKDVQGRSWTIYMVQAEAMNVLHSRLNRNPSVI